MFGKSAKKSIEIQTLQQTIQHTNGNQTSITIYIKISMYIILIDLHVTDA